MPQENPYAGCTDTMQRQHIEEHVTTGCQYTVIPCKFKRLGCETELKRKDMAAHKEDDRFHLHMAINMTAKLEKELEDQPAKLEKEFEGKMSKLARVTR